MHKCFSIKGQCIKKIRKLLLTHMIRLKNTCKTRKYPATINYIEVRNRLQKEKEKEKPRAEEHIVETRVGRHECGNMIHPYKLINYVLVGCLFCQCSQLQFTL